MQHSSRCKARGLILQCTDFVDGGSDVQPRARFSQCYQHRGQHLSRTTNLRHFLPPQYHNGPQIGSLRYDLPLANTGLNRTKFFQRTSFTYTMRKAAAIDAPFDIEHPSNFTPEISLDELSLRNSLSEKNQKQILRYLFDPHVFRFVFRQYEQKNGTTFLKPLRCLIQIGTIDAVLRGRYFLPSSKPINLDKKAMLKSATLTKCYSSETKFSKSQQKICSKTEILLIDGDCLDAALWIKREKKLNVCVHNMASASHPGGGYRRGSSAQEAYSNPPVETNEKTGESQLGRSIAQHTITKMNAILSIAIENGHDAIVLSAFGCGAYANPPLHIAKLFREVIQRFDGKFRMVVFAILNDANSFKEHNQDGNIAPFEKVFGMDAVRMESLQPDLESETVEAVEEAKVKSGETVNEGMAHNTSRESESGDEFKATVQKDVSNIEYNDGKLF